MKLEGADALASSDDAATIAEASGRSPSTTPPVRALLDRGRTIGRYTLLRELGSGGMGVVVLAYDEVLDRRVAIKVLHAHGTEHGAERMRREAQALARLSHPNVVQIYEVGAHEGHDFLVMEFVPGNSMREWLKAPRAWRDVVPLLRQVAEGLRAAHGAGLVHRDLKPDNVLIGTDGRARVVDFGLARGASGEPPQHGLDNAIDDGVLCESIAAGASASVTASAAVDPSASVLDSELTAADTILGTPAYMSPEQFTGDRVDARSDQFSFCVLAYEALFGQRPFRGGGFHRLRMKICSGQVPAPPPNDVPTWLQSVIRRGMSVDPAQRWGSMDALLAELKRDRVRRWRALGLFAAGVAALGGGIFGFAQWRSRQAQLCTGANEQVAPVWGDARQAALEQTFLGSAIPLADETWSRTRAQIDDYIERWSATRQRVCEATTVRGEQSAALLDERMACLDRKLSELDATLAVFAAGDSKHLQRAVVTTIDLERPSACATARRSDATLAPPDAQEAVARARDELARVNGRSNAGAIQPALVDARRVTTEARALGFRPLLAEALNLQGRIEFSAGEYELAETSLREAFTEALAAGDEASTSKAALSLVTLFGIKQSRFDEALEWAKIATAASERAGGSPRDEVILLAGVGTIKRKRGAHEQALADFQRAHELLLAHERPTSYSVGMSHNRVGSALLRMERYDEAERELLESARILEAVLGERHPDLVNAINNLGTVNAMRGRYEQARPYYERSIEIWEETLGPEHPSLLMPIGNLAAMLVREDELEEATRLFKRALEILERTREPGDPLIAVNANNLGVLYSKRGDHARAEQELARAVRVLEEHGRTDYQDYPQYLRALASKQLERSHHAAARESLDKALKTVLEKHGREHIETARTYLALGKLERALDRPSRALAHLETGVELLDSLEREGEERAWARFELARARWDSGASGPARELAVSALEELSQLEVDDAEGLDELRRWLARHGAD